jgi:hypothetical protein
VWRCPIDLKNFGLFTQSLAEADAGFSEKFKCRNEPAPLCSEPLGNIGDSMKEMIERIEREAGVAGLVSILAKDLAPTDLQSLLLEVYRIRADSRTPSDVLLDYKSDRFVQPSHISPIRLVAWEQISYSYLPEPFKAITLSPLCPMGTNSVVAPVDQNWAITTSRNNEVVSDSSNVLALECAVRRHELLRSNPKSDEQVHLVTNHRLVRAQKYDSPQSYSHFASFVMCSAGRDEGKYSFELSAIDMQIRFYLRALRAYLGSEVRIVVTVTDFDSQLPDGYLEGRFFPSIGTSFNNVDFRIDNQRSRAKGYYTDFAFLLHVLRGSGEELEVLDGGSVDWTQKYLSNSKERLIISGLGTERLCYEFSPIYAA